MMWFAAWLSFQTFALSHSEYILTTSHIIEYKGKRKVGMIELRQLRSVVVEKIGILS